MLNKNAFERRYDLKFNHFSWSVFCIVFIGPRYPWGPIYISKILYVTPPSLFRLNYVTQILRPLCLWQLFVSLLRVGWVAMSCCDTDTFGWDHHKIFSCFDANAHLRLCFVNHQFRKCSSASSLWESHFVFWTHCSHYCTTRFILSSATSLW